MFGFGGRLAGLSLKVGPYRPPKAKLKILKSCTLSGKHNGRMDIPLFCHCSLVVCFLAEPRRIMATWEICLEKLVRVRLSRQAEHLSDHSININLGFLWGGGGWGAGTVMYQLRSKLIRG